MVLPGLAAAGTFLGQAGSFLGGVGATAGGLSTLFGGGGGGGGATTYGGADLASMYPELAYGQLKTTYDMQRAAGREQANLQLLGGQNQLLTQTAYDQYKNALSKDQTAAGMLAGIASQAANNVSNLYALRGQGLLGLEMLGGEVAADTAKTYATAAANLQNQILTGEAGLLAPTAQATAQAGLGAMTGKNLLAQKIGETNLGIRASEQQSRLAMAQQDQLFRQRKAEYDYQRGAALGAAAGFA